MKEGSWRSVCHTQTQTNSHPKKQTPTHIPHTVARTHAHTPRPAYLDVDILLDTGAQPNDRVLHGAGLEVGAVPDNRLLQGGARGQRSGGRQGAAGARAGGMLATRDKGQGPQHVS